MLGIATTIPLADGYRFDFVRIQDEPSFRLGVHIIRGGDDWGLDHGRPELPIPVRRGRGGNWRSIRKRAEIGCAGDDRRQFA